MEIWLVVTLCLISTTGSEPIEFESFFGSDSYFSPPDDGHFESFSGYKFNPSSYGSAPVKHKFEAPHSSESLSLPLYTDGVATPPQITLSKLEKDYKTQLQRASSLTARTARYNSRIPSYRSEPYPLASNINERGAEAFTDYKTSDRDSPRSSVITPLSQKVELHTGFLPIIKGPQQNKRTQSYSSSVLKDLEPPILTASSAPSRPTVFKVSASVQSSSKIPTVPQQQKENSTATTQDQVKARQRGYSRVLNFDKDAKTLAISSSSSESVVSRVVARPTFERQTGDLLRLSSDKSGISDDVKLSAKKTLEISCNGSRDLGWCELGEKYPRKYVDQVVASCQEVIQRMYIEVPHSFEKLSETSNFKAELDNSSSQRGAKERGSHDAWSWAAYFHQGSLCDSETGFLRPETAKDSSGKWNIIVQTENIKQRIPIEMCRKTNSSCKKMLNCGLKSQCLQKYNYHLLLSLNPILKHDCPFMKLYRFPSACVCHVE